MKKMTSFFLIIVIVYFLTCLLLFLFQEKLLFHPTQLPKTYQFPFKNCTEVFLTTEDNAKHHALHFKQKKLKVAKGIVLYFHGNGGVLSRSGFAANSFTKLGYDVFMIDYRTYGKSTGKLSEQYLYKDAQMVYDYLLDDYDPENIIIYGRSLGSGIASWLAAKNEAKMLILETPFYNMKSVIKDKSFLLKLLPIDIILRYNFKNNFHIADLKMPVYVFHGTNDKVIPYKNAIKLKAIIKNGEFITIKGATHNNIVEFEQHRNKLKSILL